MKIAAYVRVSTVSQNEEGQKREIEKWAKNNGIEDVTWYLDKESGDHLDRPAFKELQKAVFDGDIKTILVYKLDRLSRTVRDGINVICDWCDKGVRLVSVTQQIDFNGTIGKIIANVLFGVAEMEQETRRERQAAGIAIAKAAGKYKGRKRGTLKASPVRVRKMKDRGFTIKEIGRALDLSHTTVIKYLKQQEVASNGNH